MQRRRAPGNTVSAVLLVGLAVLAAGCASDDRGAGAAAPSPVPVAPSVEPSAPPEPLATPGASPVAVPDVDAHDPDAHDPDAHDPDAHDPDTQASDDGTWHAKVVRALPDAVTLDKVELLTGPAAEAARVEDGRPQEPGADVPYVRNRNERLRTLPVADDLDLQVIHCPQDGCALAPWPYRDLVSGKPLPYGTPAIPFEVTVVDGSVVALSEVYLP